MVFHVDELVPLTVSLSEMVLMTLTVVNYQVVALEQAIQSKNLLDLVDS